MCDWIFFSLTRRKKSVHVFETTKTKTQAVSLHFGSESCHCFVWMDWKRDCVFVWVHVRMWVDRWVCKYSVCTRLRSVISLCKCYASTKEKRSILNSFVSWKSNSIFSDQGNDRVLFLYPEVVWEWWFYIVWESPIWIRRIGSTVEGSDYWKSTCGRRKRRMVQWLQYKLWLTLWTHALQIFDHCLWGKILNTTSSVLWIPAHYRTIFFPLNLLQRLASCRLQCSFVQISRVSVGFFGP